MKEWHSSAILVLENNVLAGICTERDIVFRVLAQGCDPRHTQLGSVMTREVQTVLPSKNRGQTKISPLVSPPLPNENGRPTIRTGHFHWGGLAEAHWRNSALRQQLTPQSPPTHQTVPAAPCGNSTTPAVSRPGR
ncbi:hypothetical protein AB6Q56_18210 [Dechloromonas sp. ARDL1]|uniref:hypothetical protein n=1 Tax=Dechloromonas sp. ARDL1 TaxID=3322121 RepID=UPI003DA73FCE